MSSEADRFRVELERLKSKYKREALRAIATATEEAYERGRKDERASQSGPAESGDDENRKQRPTALVQYVVEHIYRGLKDELADDAQLSIAKLKVVLRNSAEAALTELPTSLSGGSTTTCGHQRPLCTPQIAPPQRNLQIHACDTLQKVYLVRIRDVIDNVVKGLFVDGQYVSYAIETDVFDLHAAGHSEPTQGRGYRADRRASEVKALMQRISKDLPLAMIPPVPGRNHKILALSRNPQRPGKQEQKAQYRRRMYAQWLQYAANLAGLRGATGVDAFLGVAPECRPHHANTEGVTVCNSQAGKVSGLLLHREAFASVCIHERGSAATSIKERTQAFIRADLRFDCGDTASYTEPLDDPGPDGQNAGRVRVFGLQSAAIKDLKSADGELQMLHPRATAAMAACQELLGRWCEMSFELRSIGENLLAWKALEPADSVEHTILGAVTDRLSLLCGAQEAVGAALQTELLEPMEFLYVDCVQAARDCVQETLRRHPSSTFVPSAPYYCAEEGRHRASGLSELRRAQEGIAAAGQTAASWDACRRLRGAMTVEQLMKAAGHLSSQHRAERMIWEESLGDLRRINVATAIGTDDASDPKRRDSESSGINGVSANPYVPALQSTSECLRQMVQSELQGLSEASEQVLGGRERDSLLQGRQSDGHRSNGQDARASEVQEAGVNTAAVSCRNGGGTGGAGGGGAGLAKTLGSLASLKSVRALFTRATVPSGRRRSPSICKPTGLTPPSDEDALAAHYNATHGAPKKRKDAEGSPDANKDRKGTHIMQEPDALLQQDQRQHRVAARRQASAHGHAHSAAHTAGHIRASAVSQTPAAEAFVAAPSPASAVHIHPVFAASDAELIPPQPDSAPPAKAALRGGTDAPSQSCRKPGFGGESHRRVEESESAGGSPAQSAFPGESSSPSSADQGRGSGLGAGAGSDSPIPSGWVEVSMDDGTIYYYHSVTRVSRWDKPTEDVAAALEARIQQANAQVDEALQRHKEERVREQQMLRERESQADLLKAKVKEAVDLWAYGRALGQVAPRVPSGTGMPQHQQGPVPRDLLLLLSTLHQLVSYIPGPDAVLDSAALPQPLSVSACPSSEVKKAYMRAVRFVHPDKLPDDISLEAQMRAGAAFIILTDEFNKYRNSTNT